MKTTLNWEYVSDPPRWQSYGAFVWLTKQEGPVFVRWRLKDSFESETDHGCIRVGILGEHVAICAAMVAAEDALANSSRKETADAQETAVV